jgi:hypothetical protein
MDVAAVFSRIIKRFTIRFEPLNRMFEQLWRLEFRSAGTNVLVLLAAGIIPLVDFETPGRARTASKSRPARILSRRGRSFPGRAHP